jgi:dTDP-4-dehydrorhamnose 3,5-epimerase
MFTETPLAGLLIYKPQLFHDDRGFFAESYNLKKFEQAGITSTWVQDNFSTSKKNVLRGLHFQKPPHEQAKLVNVVKGAAFDVAVDLRPTSKTFGKWFGIELHESELKYVYIPRGFAHGFLSLSETTCFCYKVDSPYNPTADSGIHYADPDIGIKWPMATSELILSQKDKDLPRLSQLQRA